MKYPKNYNAFSKIEGCELKEGETIETKIKRIVENKEPISDTAPIIYTNRDLGVQPGFNIRTDRFDVALSAMDVANRAKLATRKNKGLDAESEQNKELESATDTTTTEVA